MQNSIFQVDLYTGGLFLQQAMGWNLYYGVLLVVFVSALYAILGGLNTVLYTDAVQVVIMVAGGITVTIVG